MANKQLLALAAKAHGDLLYVEDMDAWIHVDKDGNRGAWWNPLESSADCADMEDALGIEVRRFIKRKKAVFSSKRSANSSFYDATHIADLDDFSSIGAARRYASTMVAAKIGESME